MLEGLGILRLGRPGLTIAAGVEQSGPPALRSAPFVSGAAQTGQTLSCGTGSWAGARPISYTYQWKNAGVNLSGETAATYVLLVTDEGDAITCAVTATNGDGNASATSNTVTPSAAPTAPSNSVAPAVTGNAFTGQTLSCSTGTWSQSPTAYAYQWKRAGSNIAAATSSTYVLVLADVGQSVKCTVTASNAVGAGTPTDSSAVTPVGIPVNSVAPAVTGTTEVGQTLSCSTGTWSGSPSFTYQWKRDGVSIGGATSSTYLLDALDEATNIKCTVGASNLAGSGTSTDSNTVGPIAAADPEYFPGFTVEEEWSLVDNPADFDITVYEESSPGEWTLDLSGDLFASGRIATVADDIAHAEVFVSYIPFPQPPLSITNINMRPFVRRQDANNLWWAERAYGSGASWIIPNEKIASTQTSGTAFGTGLDNTDSTNVWYLKMQVFYDVIRAKTWTGDIVDDEPPWLGVPLRIRPASGFGGAVTTTLDNVAETGTAGLEANFGGTITGLTVKRLAPIGVNLFLNDTLDPELLDASGLPFFWGCDPQYDDQADKGVCDTVSTTLPDSSTGLALRVARDTNGSEGSGPMWQASQFLTGAADNASYTRDRPIPSVGAAFPATVDWEIWTKGTGVVDSGSPSIPPCSWVNYYPNAAGTGQNVGWPDYYWTIAPGGLGTWGWTKYTGTMTWHNFADIVLNNASIGFHNDTTTGEMLISGVKFLLPS